jgi:hypothetical protein
MYGHILIYLVLSFVSLVVIFKKPSYLKKNTQFILAYMIVFFIFVVVCAADYIRPLTTLSSGRFIFDIITLFPLMVGLCFFYFSSINIVKPHISHFVLSLFRFSKTTAIALVIIISSIIGVFSFYQSPITLRPNTMTTYAELDGVYWLLENRIFSSEIYSQGTDEIMRYAQSLWGAQETQYRKDEKIVPDHFGYSNKQMVGHLIGNHKLLVLRAGYLKMIYQNLYPQIGRFSEIDFIQLENDITIDKLYDNGEVTIWKT